MTEQVLSGEQADASLEPFRQLRGITLVPRGFLIPRRKENGWLLQRAVRELTFQKPEKRYGSKYAKKDPPTYVFIQSDDYLLVPKFWLLPLIRGKGVDVTMANEDGLPAQMTYRDDMPLFEDRRRPQQTAYRYAMEHLKRTGGVVLQMPVGTGKTNVGLRIAADSGTKVLWLAHRKNLLDQAADRVREFIPNARIGWLYAEVKDIDDKDIVFATVQSVSSKLSYTPEMFRQFGMVVLDEAHHAPAVQYVKTLFRVACPRMVALTANPERSDGLETITYHFFSQNMFVVEPTLPDGIELHTRVYRFHRRSLQLEPDMCDSAFRKKQQKILCSLAAANSCTLQEAQQMHDERLNSRPDDISEGGYSVLCAALGRMAPLNAAGVALVKQALVTPNADQFGPLTVEAIRDVEFAELHDRERSNVQVLLTDTGERLPIDRVVRLDANGNSVPDASRLRRYAQQCERQVFVTFFHKALVDHFYRRLQRSGVPAHMIGRYYGECSDEERITSLQKRIVLLTYAMAEEGLDVSTANALIMMGARGASALQTVGRVLRDKMTPAIMPLVCHMHHKWCELESGMFWKRSKEFHRYPYRERVYDIGKPATPIASASDQSTIAQYLTETAISSETVVASGAATATADSEIDQRIDECGAVSVRRLAASAVKKSSTAASKKMSVAQKLARKGERKRAHEQSEQESLLKLVEAANDAKRQRLLENASQTEQAVERQQQQQQQKEHQEIEPQRDGHQEIEQRQEIGENQAIE